MELAIFLIGLLGLYILCVVVGRKFVAATSSAAESVEYSIKRGALRGFFYSFTFVPAGFGMLPMPTPVAVAFATYLVADFWRDASVLVVLLFALTPATILCVLSVVVELVASRIGTHKKARQATTS